MTNTLGTDELFKEGDKLVSENGIYRTSLQVDGNLTISEGNAWDLGNLKWTTIGTKSGIGPFYLKMQHDSNLVIYDSLDKPTWASQTWNCGTPPYRLVLNDDGQLVSYDSDNQSIWTSAKAQPKPDTLRNDQILKEGNEIASLNGFYGAILKADGNLVVYQKIWSSGENENGEGPYHLKMQNDGDLCIYDSQNKCIWSSETRNKGNPPYNLVMQDEKQLCILDRDNRPTWKTLGRNSYEASPSDTSSYWTLRPPEEFIWSRISCDGCHMYPLVGLRYQCKQCVADGKATTSYDLCQACKEKGHEHELELVPQPVE
ncbi:unnamed protein product [Didymodactylos carnosus]|uniref:Bulb-type lectin domain-containing protein n=1 Tax=Didymodactylos carnosus TaxID=1234261 RepID=A0A815RU19_9BILA|nr:unnamed protein product [Didymodactylos carnosus]CAF1480823.1 unnamed protein product [Didymodactylos carnosus]CAF3604442.1 unnamed protein product [Didymodactylos carnosus]CAF4345898.1 unnamed protein product [Didymodactylos carnosus]